MDSQKPIKRFIPGVVSINVNKAHFLSNTHRDDARRIMDTFGDTFMAVAKGANTDELTEAGIVGIYEAL